MTRRPSPSHTTLYMSNRELAAQMTQAMQSRAVIEQAKGILIGQRRRDADEAFNILVGLSQNSHRKLRDVAKALIEHALAPKPRRPRLLVTFARAVATSRPRYPELLCGRELAARCGHIVSGGGIDGMLREKRRSCVLACKSELSHRGLTARSGPLALQRPQQRVKPLSAM